MIHQLNYMEELLKKFNMKESKVINTPIATTIKLDQYEPSSKEKLYIGMIGLSCIL